MIKISRFANALGVWDIDMSGVKIELKPKMKDVRLFRNILLNDRNRKEKSILFDKFADFMFGMVREHYPEDPETETREWIEVNLNKLFEEAMIAFRWSSREDMEKSKTESIEDLKKQMSNV